MSNISSSDAWSVKSMRRVARFLSIPWAFFALLITWMVLGSLTGEGEFFSRAVSIIILIIVALMCVGAAIIASVWGKEALGGGVLLVDGVLMIAAIICVSYITSSPREFFRSPVLVAVIFFTIVLPPLAAGSLFLACHRRSKTSGEQHV